LTPAKKAFACYRHTLANGFAGHHPGFYSTFHFGYASGFPREKIDGAARLMSYSRPLSR